MSLTVRLCGEGDAAAWLALRRRSVREHPESFHASPEDWESADVEQAAERIRRNVVVGAFTGEGALVGGATLALQARPGWKRRHKAEIWNVYLAPEHRGAGAAPSLVEPVIAEERELGHEAVVLGVTGEAPAARRLYESLGFTTYGIEPRALRLPDGRVLDDRLMQLDLR